MTRSLKTSRMLTPDCPKEDLHGVKQTERCGKDELWRKNGRRENERCRKKRHLRTVCSAF